MAMRGPILAVLVSTFCCIGQAQAGTTGSLYSRLGGSTGVNALLGEAMGPALADDGVRQQLADHICALAGGGCDSPRAPRLSDAQFVQMVEALRASMRVHEVPLAARNELLEALAPLRHGT